MCLPTHRTEPIQFQESFKGSKCLRLQDNNERYRHRGRWSLNWRGRWQQENYWVTLYPTKCLSMWPTQCHQLQASHGQLWAWSRNDSIVWDGYLKKEGGSCWSWNMQVRFKSCSTCSLDLTHLKKKRVHSCFNNGQFLAHVSYTSRTETWAEWKNLSPCLKFYILWG